VIEVLSISGLGSAIEFPRAAMPRRHQPRPPTSLVCFYSDTMMSAWWWKLLGAGESPPESRKKPGVVAMLYFIQGAPAAVLWEVLPVSFRLHGVSLRAMGGLRLLELPYSLKVFWWPAVVSMNLGRLWIYLAAPVAGALAGVYACRCARAGVCCAGAPPDATFLPDSCSGEE